MKRTPYGIMLDVLREGLRKERARKTQRAYYARHREKILERLKLWKYEHGVG